MLPNREASREGYLRVIDESGEDYIYPATCSYRSSCLPPWCGGSEGERTRKQQLPGVPFAERDEPALDYSTDKKNAVIGAT